MTDFIRFLIDHPQFVSAGAAVLSACAALASIILTIIIFARTNNKLKPFERPILYLDEIKFISNAAFLVFWIKNLGRRPASAVSITMCTARKAHPEHLAIIKTASYGQKIFPNQAISVIIPANIEDPKFLYLFLKYGDALSKRTTYREEFWFIAIAHEFPEPISGKELEAVLPFATKLVPERKEID